jgi:hypothetical protein
MDKNWKIYIVAHSEVVDRMFECDKQFGNEHYCVLNVGSREKLINENKYDCIRQYELPNSVMLGKWWAESEGIYNIWRSGIYKKLDYIGFIHYDKELRLLKKHIFPWKNTNITQRINQYLNKHKDAHISLETHNIAEDYAQYILADINQPNVLTGKGFNCYDYIINDYNEYFHANHTIDEYIKKKYINLCSCFLIDCRHFDEMMKFWDWVVQSGKLNVFDTEHKHRLQGGLAERYFGVYLVYAYDKFLDLSLVHHYNEGLKNR